MYNYVQLFIVCIIYTYTHNKQTLKFNKGRNIMYIILTLKITLLNGHMVL